MKAAGQFLFTVALGLAYSLAQAATLSKLWSWFIAAQYGTGPTYAVWYGFSLVVGIMLAYPLAHLAKDKDTKAITTLVAALIVLAATLGVSWCVGHLFGWL